VFATHVNSATPRFETPARCASPEKLPAPTYTLSIPSSCAVQNQEGNAAPHLYSIKTASHAAPHISYLLQILDVVAAVLAAHRVVEDYQPDRLDVHHGRCRDRQTRTGLAYPHCFCPSPSTTLCKLHAFDRYGNVDAAVRATASLNASMDRCRLRSDRVANTPTSTDLPVIATTKRTKYTLFRDPV
jgi:hypothetical protein